MLGHPKKLITVPIIQAVAEFRFAGGPEESGAILLGLLYSQFRDKFPKMERLPLAEVPAGIRRVDPSMRFAPTFRLSDADRCGVLIGDHVLSVYVMEPYPGWSEFQPLISSVWNVAQNSGVVSNIERMSVKYINLLAAKAGDDHLKQTNIRFELGPFSVASRPFQLRTELSDRGLIAIVEVAAQAKATVPKGGERVGLVLDIDVVKNGPIADFWKVYPQLLEGVHAYEKEVFFSLVNPKTLETYGPIY